MPICGAEKFSSRLASLRILNFPPLGDQQMILGFNYQLQL
jgi:hypothetical protein